MAEREGATSDGRRVSRSRTALAVNGGRPVRDRLLPYGHQVVDDADIAAVVRVLQGEWLTTGPAVAEFEERFAAVVGARYAVAVSSGTAALHAAAHAAGLGPGDEVVVPALTFAATANAVCYLGARPVFADVRRDTLNLDADGATGVEVFCATQREVTPRFSVVAA